MVSEPNTERCASRRPSPRGEWTPCGVPARTKGSPTSIGEGNEAFLIMALRVWILLPSRRVLKTLMGSLKGQAQRGLYLLAVNLDLGFGLFV